MNDEVAAELIAEFYARLSQPDLSRARALQQAQTKLIRTDDLNHPYFWSPFVLINSWL